jgi:class 3 adenylate cyclase
VVQPESFDTVTIYFSDVVGFIDFVSHRDPLDVVTFLSNMYISFDTVLSEYDIYKVETISDSYVVSPFATVKQILLLLYVEAWKQTDRSFILIAKVASGLPIRNEDRHASEVALMGLRLLDLFKNAYPDGHLQLRIGINSGVLSKSIT